VTAIPAGRTALGNILLPAPCDNAVAAIPGRNCDLGLIDKLHAAA
jgi:hypothetical protein